MAPQIVFRSTYTKLVDIWSCSIIMFMLFNDGKHPIYRSKMTSEEYKKKLSNFTFPTIQNQLAQSFIQKIGKSEALERYNATEALKHPWLTRRFEDQIPLSIHQSFKSFENNQKIHNIIVLSLVIDYKLFEKQEYSYSSQYLTKCEFYSSISRQQKYKFQEEKKLKKKKLVSAEHIKELFGGYSIQNLITNNQNHKTIETQTINPKIQKLNDIFTNYFDRKANKHNLGNSQSIQKINKTQPSADLQNRQRIQLQIQESVRQFKEKLQKKNRRIFSKNILKLQKNNQNIFQKREIPSSMIIKEESNDKIYSLDEEKMDMKSIQKAMPQKRNKTSIKIKQIKNIKEKKIGILIKKESDLKK